LNTINRVPVRIEPLGAVELRHALRDRRIQLALVFRVTRERAAPFRLIQVHKREVRFAQAFAGREERLAEEPALAHPAEAVTPDELNERPAAVRFPSETSSQTTKGIAEI
jgi:hypothetical protein